MTTLDAIREAIHADARLTDDVKTALCELMTVAYKNALDTENQNGVVSIHTPTRFASPVHEYGRDKRSNQSARQTLPNTELKNGDTITVKFDER